MDSSFPDLYKSLAEHNIKTLLIGGHAMQAYGVVRQTLDMDWLAMDEDVPKIKDVMKYNDYDLLAETDNFLRFRHQESGMLDIDVLIVDRKTFEMLYNSGSTLETPLGKWRIPSPAHFISLKLHAVKNNPLRETRDVADIVDILRMVGSGISQDDLRQLCEKYGPGGIYDRIRRHLS